MTSTIERRLVRGALVLALLAAPVAAQACNCPKKQLMKKYGTVSQVQTKQPLPLPPPLPISKAPPSAGG